MTRPDVVRASPSAGTHGRRSRIPVPPLLEAVVRLAAAYARDQYGLRRNRPVPRFAWRTAYFLAAGLLRDELEADMSGLRVLLNTKDRTMARSVYACGDWDPLLVGAAYEALAEAGRDVRGRTFVEIGANFGVYALPAVAERGFARAIAYEPDPVSFDLLARNIARNGLGDLVAAHRAALSDAPGQIVLHRSRTNAGDNRVVALEERDRGAMDVVARATTFDDEVVAGNIPLDDVGLVWLDVQGHEDSVLAGASRLLASDVPVVVEYCTGMMSREGRRRLDGLIAANYDLIVDLGRSTLRRQVRFEPADSIGDLLPSDRKIETDLLLLRR